MVTTLAELDELLSRPRPALVQDLASLAGDIVVVGAGGKLGPSLVELAVRADAAAGTRRTVFAVSRFGGSAVRERLAAIGATVVTADVADPGALARLPDAPNLVYLVGAKFGTAGNEAFTWHTNVCVPARVIERYSSSRFVALSSGNVYPFVAAASGGCEEDSPVGPVGEYAMSCVGRERVIGHVAGQHGIRGAVLRLNYAVEARYGVLLDLAQALVEGRPIDLTMGQVNVVWQGYANEVALRSLTQVDDPPFVLNVAGPETASVRRLATMLAQRLGVGAAFVGEEAPTALLSNGSRCHRLFGYPSLCLDELVELTAAWVAAGLPTSEKPTSFERRDGKF